MNEASASLNRLKTSAGIAIDGIPHHSPHPTNPDANTAAAAYLAQLHASQKAPGDPGARFAVTGLASWPAATIQIVTPALPAA